MKLFIPPFPAVIARKSGLYYGPEGTISTAIAPPAGDLRLVPIYFPTRRSLDRIAVNVTIVGEAGSVIRLGVYDSLPGESYPGSLLLDAGTVVGDVGTGVKAITIALNVGPGIIWLACVAQVAATTRPTLQTLSGSDYNGLFGSSAGVINGNTSAYLQTGVSGALPGTFTVTPANSVGHFVQVRMV